MTGKRSYGKSQLITSQWAVVFRKGGRRHVILVLSLLTERSHESLKCENQLVGKTSHIREVKTCSCQGILISGQNGRALLAIS